MLRIFGTFALLLAVCATGFAGDDDPDEGDLAGIYHMRSTENGTTFYGVAIVGNIGDKVYMHTVFGAKSTVSVGIRDGNTIAVSFPLGEGRTGVTLYTIDPKTKEWSGKWRGGGSSGTETATFIRKTKDKEL